MTDGHQTMRIPNRRPLGAAFAFVMALSLAYPAVAASAEKNWSDLTSGDIGSWTGQTGQSASGTNFFNTDGASDNTLIIQDARAGTPPQISGDIYGGYSSTESSTHQFNTGATAIDNNTVIVRAPTPGATAATADGKNIDVYGGFKYNQGVNADHNRSISNNTVIIESGVNLGSGMVAGAYVSDSVSNNTLERVSNNRVIIHGGAMSRIFGAGVDIRASNLSAVDNNSVEINLKGGGVLKIYTSNIVGRGTIYGGDFHGGSATNNRVRFYADDSSSVNTPTAENINIIGGRSGFFPGEASGNEVDIEISGRTTVPITFNDITGGSSGNDSRQDPSNYGENKAYRNTVTIRGNVITFGDVVGGRAYSGIAADNSVNLTDVTAEGKVMGGHAVDSRFPDQTLGVADNNRVNILRGTINGNIYGGLDASSTGKSASGNNVIINDASIGSAFVYGGFSAAESKNNAVHISGSGTRFTTPATVLAGGNHSGQNGNTLTTSNAVNLRLGKIENFEKYVFNMTGNEMGKTVYSVANPVDFTGTSHTLNFDATVGPPLREGQSLVLIDNTVNGNTLPDGSFVKNLSAQLRDGFIYDYDSYFGMKGGALVFEITGRRQNERNITFGQSQLAGLQMVNVASDLARDIHRLSTIPCVADCHDASGNNPCPEKAPGPVVFAGTKGGSYNWNTGHDSRLDLDFFAMVAGAGWRNDGLLLAGFFETGRGKYDGKVGGRTIMDGDEVSYTGGGALIRYEANKVYGEAGFHAGQVKTDVDSSTFGSKSAPIHVKYDTRASYAGLDALLGYKLQADCSTFDFSARYSWNYLEGDDFTTRGARFEQGSVNSHRLRAGVEWSYANGAFHPYAGTFFEYEMDAESEHRVFGEELRQASQKGSSGIGKLGLRFGGGERRFSLDLGVEGHVGQQRGFAGKILVGYDF